ncbi:MAG: helix-turn-helix transcriptional regulator [Pseudomonadota bacterium]
MAYEHARSDSIDKVIGTQIRQRRIMMGLTQDQVADTLGISYQQIQKYETGSNRVSASRLYEIATLLNTDIGWFFPSNDRQYLAEDSDSASPRHVIELVRRFSRIENQKVRAGIMALIRSIADHDSNSEISARSEETEPA